MSDECPDTLRVPYSWETRDMSDEDKRQALLDRIIADCQA